MQQERILGGLSSEIRFCPQVAKVNELLTHPEVSLETLDAIVVMGASMDYHSPARRWHFPLIVYNGVGKVDGGNLRMIAASQLVAEGYTKQFLVTGGAVEHPEGGKSSQAAEMAQQMIQRRRIPTEQVISIGRETSTNTHGNVIDVVEYLTSHPEVVKSRKLGILATDWHMLRALLIFDEHPFFADHGITLVPINANEVITRRSSHHAAWEQAIDAIPEMENRIELEKQGITDLVQGTYKPRH